MINDKTVTVEGLKELEAALADIAETPRRRVGRNALKAGGEITARRARELAPKDEGHLAESIDVSGKLSRSQKSKHKKHAADIEQFVGPGTHPQAITQEFGTVFHPPNFMRRHGIPQKIGFGRNRRSLVDWVAKSTKERSA